MLKISVNVDPTLTSEAKDGFTYRGSVPVGKEKEVRALLNKLVLLLHGVADDGLQRVTTIRNGVQVTTEGWKEHQPPKDSMVINGLEVFEGSNAPVEEATRGDEAEG